MSCDPETSLCIEETLLYYLVQFVSHLVFMHSANHIAITPMTLLIHSDSDIKQKNSQKQRITRIRIPSSHDMLLCSISSRACSDFNCVIFVGRRLPFARASRISGSWRQFRRWWRGRYVTDAGRDVWTRILMTDTGRHTWFVQL